MSGIGYDETRIFRLKEAKIRRETFEHYLQYNPESHETLGTRLRNLRQYCGFTIKETAWLLGVSYRTIGHWEIDESCPGWFELKEIGIVFNISLDRLLLGIAPLDRQMPARLKGKISLPPRTESEVGQ